MKFTIVTVCRNAENSISKTIDSVLEQSFTDFEYLIIDGASTDNTLTVIESYRDRFVEKNISYITLSEPDKGIYDAMNKGIDKANGEWILFMNSGDFFYDKEVLSKLGDEEDSDSDIVYGDVLITENNMYKFNPAGVISDQGLFSPICHQGMMTRTSVMKKHKFIQDYKFAADYDSMIRIYKDGGRFKKTSLIIAVFELGGASFKNSVNYLREMYSSRKTNGVASVHNRAFSELKLSSYLALRIIVKKILGKNFYMESRGWKSERF